MAKIPGAAVQVRNLAKRYGQVAAVRDVSFDAAAGEIFGLLGRNGAGKTTALECVLGLRQADGGTIALAGVDTVAEPHRARALVGAQLQAATLQDKMTPRQALNFFGSFHRRSLPAEQLLEEFALGANADASFDSLSGGQRQRLFLALAFVNQPSVVVLDEPTAGLDPQARRDLHQVISRARATGVAVVLSTHDLDEAEHLCDRIGILHEGRLVATGTPAELIAQSHRRPRIAVRTALPVDLRMVGQNAAAGMVVQPAAGESAATTAVLECHDVNATLIAIVQHLGLTQNTLLDVQIQRPSLEDVFIELTGRAWNEGEGIAP